MYCRSRSISLNISPSMPKTEKLHGILDSHLSLIHIFTQFPFATVATTFSATNGVTDSAAAGTALATGNKTKNGTLGMKVVYNDPEKSNLVAGFVLRCFQHLSDPDLDTRQCTWRHNRQTRGLSNTVLSLSLIHILRIDKVCTSGYSISPFNRILKPFIEKRNRNQLSTAGIRCV